MMQWSQVLGCTHATELPERFDPEELRRKTEKYMAEGCEPYEAQDKAIAELSLLGGDYYHVHTVAEASPYGGTQTNYHIYHHPNTGRYHLHFNYGGRAAIRTLAIHPQNMGEPDESHPTLEAATEHAKHLHARMRHADESQRFHYPGTEEHLRFGLSGRNALAFSTYHDMDTGKWHWAPENVVHNAGRTAHFSPSMSGYTPGHYSAGHDTHRAAYMEASRKLWGHEA